MFGYVKPYTPELKIIEDSYYKATYCGLCRAMRAETGLLSSLFLSYDIAFLACIRLAVTGERPEFEKKRCPMHIFKKRLVMLPNEALSFSAKAGLLLSFHKLEDDIADEKGFRLLRAYVLKLLLSRSFRAAAEELSELDASLVSALSELRGIEKEKVRSADMPSALFGHMMEKVFAYGLKDERMSKIAAATGYHVGRWIYITDALDDMENDLANGSYNPFVMLYEGKSLDTDKKSDIEGASSAVLAKASAAIDLLDFGDRRDLGGLIRNILSEGMPRITHNILFGCKTAATYENENGEIQ
ncbi:MAG: DUF5685 family protein [Eubacteriales bacterium]